VAGRGLYRQWGITPRPEDKGFSCFLGLVYDRVLQKATPNLKSMAAKTEKDAHFCTGILRISLKMWIRTASHKRKITKNLLK